VKFLRRGSTDTRKSNIFLGVHTSLKFHMTGAHGKYLTVPYQSFKEGVERHPKSQNFYFSAELHILPGRSFHSPVMAGAAGGLSLPRPVATDPKFS
jgi:hypothetical protein